MATPEDRTSSGRGTPTTEKKALIVQYNRAEIRLVTPENVK